MKPKSAIQKGKELENYISNQIILKGLDDRSRRADGSGNGNREKRDIDTSIQINGRTIGIEAKNYKVAHVQEWWDQAKKLETLDYEPVVVYKLSRESFGDTKAIIYLNTLLDLIAGQSGGKSDGNTGIAQSDKWLLRKGVDVLKDIIKVLERYLG